MLKPRSRRPGRKSLRFESLEDRRLLAGLYPNDPGFSQQWALHNTGQTGGVFDADVDAPEAWSVTTGSMATVAAILDEGVDYTHRDLYLNIWLNPGEVPAAIASSLADTDSDGIITFRDLNAAQNASYVNDLNTNGYIDGGDLLSDPAWENGLDEDGNAFTDDLVGWDFVDNDNNPQNPAGFNHGTNGSLIIGAMGNNGLGGAGLNWSIRMIPVRIRYGSGDVVTSRVVAGLDYGVTSRAQISYQGWRGSPQETADVFSQQIYDSIDRARQAGQLIVTAAGNGSRDSDAHPWYPGAYNLDNIISAAAVDDKNQLTSWSNWGATSVDIGVPSYDGVTSNALSVTTGVAALLKSAHPDWNYAQIKERIFSIVDPLSSLTGKTVTGGRLNAANALGVVQIVPTTKFYVVNEGSPDRTYEYAATGEVTASYNIGIGNTAPRGAASTVAGDKVWVVDANKTVYVYDSGGTPLGSWTAGSMTGAPQVEGIATNGSDVWIVDAKIGKVFKYTGAASRLSGSQNAASSFTLNKSNKSPKDIVTDGTHLWIVDDSSTDKVFKYTLNGSIVGSWAITTSGATSPTGITLDPASPSDLWIVDNGTDKIYQYNGAATKTSGSLLASATFALAPGNTNPQGIADPPAAEMAALLDGPSAVDWGGTSPSVSRRACMPNRRPAHSTNTNVTEADDLNLLVRSSLSAVRAAGDSDEWKPRSTSAQAALVDAALEELDFQPWLELPVDV